MNRHKYIRYAQSVKNALLLWSRSREDLGRLHQEYVIQRNSSVTLSPVIRPRYRWRVLCIGRLGENNLGGTSTFDSSLTLTDEAGHTITIATSASATANLAPLENRYELDIISDGRLTINSSVSATRSPSTSTPSTSSIFVNAFAETASGTETSRGVYVHSEDVNEEETTLVLDNPYSSYPELSADNFLFDRDGIQVALYPLINNYDARNGYAITDLARASFGANLIGYVRDVDFSVLLYNGDKSGFDPYGSTAYANELSWSSNFGASGTVSSSNPVPAGVVQDTEYIKIHYGDGSSLAEFKEYNSLGLSDALPTLNAWMQSIVGYDNPDTLQNQCENRASSRDNIFNGRQYRSDLSLPAINAITGSADVPFSSFSITPVDGTTSCTLTDSTAEGSLNVTNPVGRILAIAMRPA